MALIKYILIANNFDLIYKEMLTKNTCFHKSLLNTTNTCSFNKFFKLWVKLINNLKKKCDFSLKLKKSFIKTGRFVMSIILLMFRNKLKKKITKQCWYLNRNWWNTNITSKQTLFGIQVDFSVHAAAVYLQPSVFLAKLVYFHLKLKV